MLPFYVKKDKDFMFDFDFVKEKTAQI